MKSLNIKAFIACALLVLAPVASAGTSVTWNGTSYTIPASGEVGWSALRTFLIDLGQHAQTTNFQLHTVRKATTTPVTVSASTDYAVVTQLAAPAAVTVNLPAGVDGQVFIVADGTGDANTNNITINRNGSDTIAGSTTLVLDHARQVVMLGYTSTGTDWKILNKSLPPGTVVNADVASTAAIAYSKLNLGTSIVNADVSTSAAIAGSKLQAADTSNAGTISYYNDFIANSWTPTVTNISGTSGTWSTHLGYMFTAIGRKVCVQGFESGGTSGGTTSAVSVTLPITAYSTSRQIFYFPCYITNSTSAIAACKLDTNASTTAFFVYKDAAQSGLTTGTATEFSFNFCYQR